MRSYPTLSIVAVSALLVFSGFAIQESFADNANTVKCNSGLFLIYKYDNSSACVKQNSAINLIQRGWGNIGNMDIKISTDKLRYFPAESVLITISNNGTATAIFTYGVGYSIKTIEGISIQYVDGSFEEYSSFLPNDQKQFSWDQVALNTLNPKQVEPGIYTVMTSYRDVTQVLHTSEQTFEVVISDEYYEFKKTINPLITNEFEKSDFIFVGKLITKVNSTTVPEFFTLTFETTENLKNKFNDEITIGTHEGAWKNCILQEGNDYLVFVTHQKLQHICTYAINSSDDLVDDIRELSFNLYQR